MENKLRTNSPLNPQTTAFQTSLRGGEANAEIRSNQAQPQLYQPIPRGLEGRIADKLAHLRKLDEGAGKE